MKHGWQRSRLGEFVATVSTGPFGSLLHKSDYVDDGVPLVNPTNIVGERIVPDPTKLIDEATKQRLISYILRQGDIVVGRRGEIGRCAVVGSDESGWVCGTGCFFIRPLPAVDSQFLAHLIRSDGYREKLEKASTGTTMMNLSNTALGDLVITIPPLPEQRRIISILDAAFDGIATAKANAEKNLQNARALFESHLQSIFTETREEWAQKTLFSLCHKITVGHVGSMAKRYTSSGVPFLRSQNIRPFQVSMENVVFIDDGFHSELTKSRLRPGDLAIVRTGYPGTAAVIPPELPDANCSDLVIVRPREDVNPNYLAAFFNSAYGKNLVSGKLVGAAQQHFNVTAAKAVVLRLPPIDQQEAIVAMVELVRAETQRLEFLYQRKLDALDALKKSLLHQAFTGAL